MSKSSDLSKVAKQYIIDSIDNSGYSDQKLGEQEKIKFLRDTFRIEKQWEIDQIGELKALASHIQGLPSYFNIEYRNHEILKIAVKWGSLPVDATEQQEQKILDNWPNFIANKTTQLFRTIKD